MARIAFIQRQESGEPYSGNGAAAARGFEMLGYNVQVFDRTELDDLPLARETVVVGGVGTVRAALARIGVAPPTPLNLPSVLEPYWGRRIWTSSIGSLLREPCFPVFVKPLAFSKLFNGRIVRAASELKALLTPREGFPELTEDTPVQVQEIVCFLSEWRAFVIRGTVQGLSHYSGDPLRFPSANIIRATVGAFTLAPAGYAADFGVTDDGRTLLVEVNDGYALGQGGLVADRYAQLLKARWAEMVG
jgi:hypothetical protein